MTEKEARTNKAGADLDKRNRNWQKIDTHLAESANQIAALDTAKASKTELQTVDARIDQIIVTPAEGITEQEIIDARQGATSLGTNLTEIKKGAYFPITNIIKSDSWLGDANSDVSVTDNTITVTGTGSGAQPVATQTTDSVLEEMKKYYISAKVRVTNDDCQKVNIQAYSSTVGFVGTLVTQENPVNGQWYPLSGILTVGEFTGDFKILIRSVYIDATTANGTVTEIEDVIIIDLTENFGTANEPNIEQIQSILSEYPSSWFGGTVNIAKAIKNAKDVKLFDLSTTFTGDDVESVLFELNSKFDVTQSTVKNKTFESTDARFEELEADTYFPITNLTDAIVDVNTDGIADGWTKGTNIDVYSVADGYQKFTGSGSIADSGQNSFYRSNTLEAEKKYAVAFKAKRTNSGTTNTIQVGNGLASVCSIELTDDYVLYIIVFTSASSEQYYFSRIAFGAELGLQVEIGYITVIDMANAFGTEEPTSKEIEFILKQCQDDWVDGTINIANSHNIRKCITVASNNIAKIKVMTHNIGYYAYGIAYGIPNEDINAKKPLWRNLISKNNCDILNLNETNQYLDANSTLVAYNELYKNSYDTYITGGYYQGFASKYSIVNATATPFTESGAYGTRYIYKCYITINARTICLINVHLTPGDSLAVRQAQTEEILTVLQNEEYFILCGDFNAATTTEYAPYLVAGYNVANCGYFGNLLTAPYTAPSMVYDNIITSQNIKIDNAYIDEYVTSDHLPIIADLTIY